jgi:voltage-gated sodium channel
MKLIFRQLIKSKRFEYLIIFVIIVNSILIGIQTYFNSPLIDGIQNCILTIFILEINLRWFSFDSQKDFFKDGWNIFDLLILIISIIPDYYFSESQIVTTLRVLRIFRIIRIFRFSSEIKLIVSVLLLSFKSLFYNSIIFFIFLYLFSLIGVTIFRLPLVNNSPLDIECKIYDYWLLAPNVPVNSPDPYGTLGETMFTLFRILTGEDWSDLRYNLIIASKLDLISVSEIVVTSYHVLWIILSAFLLLNLLVGAILNNYQILMNEYKPYNSKNNVS